MQIQDELKMKKKSDYTIEVKTMCVRETGEAQQRIRTPNDMFRLWKNSVTMASWFSPDKESMVAFLLTAKNICRGFEMVTMGLLDASLVHPREIYRTAIVGNAAAITLAHNHPSGDPTPSAEDIRITKQLIEAGKIVDIKLQDHVIIGDLYATEVRQRMFSLREENICVF